jgi:hypothetical protein
LRKSSGIQQGKKIERKKEKKPHALDSMKKITVDLFFTSLVLFRLECVLHRTIILKLLVSNTSLP